jgi:hypothetical protein
VLESDLYPRSILSRRKRNERFFASGRLLVDLVESSAKKVAKAIASQTTGRNARRNSQIDALENVLQEATALRKTLLSVRCVTLIVFVQMLCSQTFLHERAVSLFLSLVASISHTQPPLTCSAYRHILGNDCAKPWTGHSAV